MHTPWAVPLVSDTDEDQIENMREAGKSPFYLGSCDSTVAYGYSVDIIAQGPAWRRRAALVLLIGGWET